VTRTDAELRQCGKWSIEMSDLLAVCTHCNAVNRLPPSRPAERAKCGQCGTRLFAGKPADVSAQALELHVQRGTLPVVVDVWAPWCGPCRMMAPAYEAAATQLEPEIRLLKLNSDVERQAAAQFQIRGIPTMILFRNGGEIARTSGAMSAPQIVHWVRERLTPAAA
jgi:thioredoxin 2